MDITALLQLLRRWWLVLALVVLAASWFGHHTAAQRAPVYESEVRLLVGPINADEDVLRASGRLAQTYAELATGTNLRAEVIDELELEVDPEAVDVRASASEVTRLLTVQVRYHDQQQVAVIADGIARRLIALGDRPVPVNPDRIDIGDPAPPPEVRPEGRLSVVSEATVPDGPEAPEETLSAVLSGLAGLAAALAPILLYEYTNPRVRDVTELHELTSVPLLGAVGSHRPRRRRPPSQRLVVNAMPRSLTAESFRVAATELEAAVRTHDRLHSLLVTGTRPDDGSGDLAANLCAALAGSGHRVLLVDDDTAAQQVSRYLDDGSDQGSLTVDLRRGPAMTVLRYRDVMADLDYESSAARHWIDGQLEDHDVVVVHAGPPAGSLSTLVWAGSVDGSILAVRREVTRRSEVTEALAGLARVQANVVGVVFDRRGAGIVRSLRVLLRRQRRRLGGIVRGGADPHDEHVRYEAPDASSETPRARPELASVRPGKSDAVVAERDHGTG